MNIYKESTDKLRHWSNLFVLKFFGGAVRKSAQTEVIAELSEGHLVNSTYFLALLRVLAEKHGISRDDVQRAYAEEAEKICARFERDYPGFVATEKALHKADPAKAEQTMAKWG